MLLAFIDEFGELASPSEHSHPAFGFGGIIIDSTHIDAYLKTFLSAKATLFQKKHRPRERRLFLAETKEVKGSKKLTSKGPVEKGKLISQSQRRRKFFFLIRVLTELQKYDGKVFYHGVIKYTKKGHPFQTSKVYESFARSTVRKIGSYARDQNKSIVWVFDQNSIHKNWLVQADTNDRTKTSGIVDELQMFMFNERLNKMSIAPPFQTDSKLSYMIESADWFCALLRHVVKYQLAIFNNSLDVRNPPIGLAYYDFMFRQHASEIIMPKSVIKLNRHSSLPLDQISQFGLFDDL